MMNIMNGWASLYIATEKRECINQELTCCNSKSPRVGWWNIVVFLGGFIRIFLSCSTASSNSWLPQNQTADSKNPDRINVAMENRNKNNLKRKKKEGRVISIYLLGSFKLMACQHIGHCELLWHLYICFNLMIDYDHHLNIYQHWVSNQNPLVTTYVSLI